MSKADDAFLKVVRFGGIEIGEGLGRATGGIDGEGEAAPVEAVVFDVGLERVDMRSSGDQHTEDLAAGPAVEPGLAFVMHDAMENLCPKNEEEFDPGDDGEDGENGFLWMDVVGSQSVG